MKATITSIKPQTSKHGGICHLITFKGEDGKSYRTWVVKGFGNYRRWQEIIAKGVGLVVTGLTRRGEGLIDADSVPQEVTPRKD